MDPTQTPSDDCSQSQAMDPVAFFRHRFPHILDQIFDYASPKGCGPWDCIVQTYETINDNTAARCCVSREWSSYMDERADRGRDPGIKLMRALIQARPDTWEKARKYGVEEKQDSNPIQELKQLVERTLQEPVTDSDFDFFDACSCHHVESRCAVCLCVLDRMLDTEHLEDLRHLFKEFKERGRAPVLCGEIDCWFTFIDVASLENCNLPWLTNRVKEFLRTSLQTREPSY